MIYANSKSFFTVWKGKFEERYSEFALSTSRKDKATGNYKNSNWRFVRFVGEAFEKSSELQERDRITNVDFALELEPYTGRSGETVYPDKPRFVVFSFDIVPKKEEEAAQTKKPKSQAYAEDPSDDGDFDDSDGDLPF